MAIAPRLLFLAIGCFCVPIFAQWTVVYRNAVELDAAGTFAIEALSGITYIQPLSGDLHRVATIQDDGGTLGQANISLSPNGSIQSAVAVSSVTIADDRADNEGIAFSNLARNSVFIASERDLDLPTVIPSVREYDLTTGVRLQSVALPNPWNTAGNTRLNQGFESMTRMVHGKSMWTGNEEALTIDGPESNAISGTTVRLQRMSVSENLIAADEQFAYVVSPIHSASGPVQSGLVDLVGLPDGTLMTLERSAATTIPVFQNSIFQVEISSATNLNASEFDGGLINQTYTPVTKTMLWSGAVNGFLGSNLEGLALGPRLANGNWSLIGVTDNGGSGSGNNIVAFELIPPLAYGDFNRDGSFDCHDAELLAGEILSASSGTNTALFDLTGDGVVNKEDQTRWLSDAATARGFRTGFLPGDADLDGHVGEADFAVWNQNRFSSVEGWCRGDFNLDGFVDASDFNIWNANNTSSNQQTNVAIAIPEPNPLPLLMIGIGNLMRVRRRKQ